MKNKILLFLTCLFLSFLCGCGLLKPKEVNKKVIVTTQYPQYQFVKELLGDDIRLNDYYEVSLIVPPGADSHSFDPRLNDLIKIKNSDLFLYTSDALETWVTKLDVSKYTKKVDLSKSEGIKLITVQEHNHGCEEEDDCDDDHDHHAHHAHEHEEDPHYWVYPPYAIAMAKRIRQALLDISPDLAKECQDLLDQNLEKLILKLENIDQMIKKVIENAKTKTLYFASPFSFYYWSYYYDLEYVLTYATCSTEVEPPINTIIEVINEIRKNDVKVIYIKELLSDGVAQMIARETNAKILLLHSCHNVNKSDFEKEISFVEIMEKNVENLSIGLGVDINLIKEEVKNSGAN